MSDDSGWGTAIILIWLFLLTAAIVIFGVLVGTNRVDFGPTGPTGPSAGSGVALTLQNDALSVLNQNLLSSVNTCQCSNVALPPIQAVNNCGCRSGGVGTVLNSASCTNCNFNTVNGLSSVQIIEGNNVPQIVNFVLTSNVFTYDGMGTLTLPVGQYTVSCNLVYNAINMTNVKYLAFWLRTAQNSGVVSTNDLIGPIVNSTSQTLTKTASFAVQNNLTNKFSVLTWHGLQVNEMIDNRTQFTLRRIA